ncbi:3-keto-5-aminohexanoate cleavage protein [Xanthobacter autotrophicus]|uniref:3-keto-5-aminohexanoate cleavage protein n=1 Tax=Xanthobacter autotrophicus TaxID=280 RepID=UPI001E4FCBB2|nr:3-keto-5-aminohexanoate cleavage protein [Xanthobacter autotrophicus]UDQ87953.1 3-keto-5-aminohexanoate cleavage protein [Xanthobacter autotrophicus]
MTATAPAEALLWPPLVIANAPNGATRTKADHPALPMTAAELARNAAEIVEAGAALIHIHVRDAEGRHLLDADAYREATAAIRREVGDRLVVQATSEAAGRYKAPEQIAVVRALRPEAVSLALREIIPDEAHEAAAADFFASLRRERIMVQIILYSPEEVHRYSALKGRGVLGDGEDFPLFVLGRYTSGQVSTPADLVPFLAAAGTPPRLWAMCAFGPKENACALTAAGLGGHVRVGFENNLFAPDGTLADANAAQVRRAAEGARLLNRPLATADAVRGLYAA